MGKLSCRLQVNATVGYRSEVGLCSNSIHCGIYYNFQQLLWSRDNGGAQRKVLANPCWKSAQIPCICFVPDARNGSLVVFLLDFRCNCSFWSGCHSDLYIGLDFDLDGIHSGDGLHEGGFYHAHAVWRYWFQLWESAVLWVCTRYVSTSTCANKTREIWPSSSEEKHRVDQRPLGHLLLLFTCSWGATAFTCKMVCSSTTCDRFLLSTSLGMDSLQDLIKHSEIRL